jgi:hypothetical protein
VRQGGRIMKSNGKMLYILAIICLLSILFTSCGNIRIPYSELPEPENYALTVNDLPDLGVPWSEEVQKNVGEEENERKIYVVKFSGFGAGGNGLVSVFLLNDVTVYQSNMSQSEIPEPVSEQGSVTVTWRPASLLYPIGDKALVWLGTDGIHPTTIYCYLSFFKTNVWVYLVILADGFTEENTLDLAHDLARKVEMRIP